VPQSDAALRDPVPGRDGQAGRRVAPPGHRDRRGVHERPGARALPAGRPEGRGEHRLPRPRVRPGAGRQGAPGVRRPGPQPGPQHPHRWGLDGLQRRLRTAVRPRGRGAPRRDDGRLPPLHPARAELRRARLRRWGGLRAERHAARLTSPGHDPGAADAHRQGLHGQRRVGRERQGHDRDGGDPLRRAGGDRADAGLHLAGQLQLAAALGRPHARCALRVRLRAPAGRDHAVHPHGRDVAGDDPRCSRAADRRGALRHRAGPADQPRGAGDLRVVPVQHRHAVGLPDLRHAGVRHRPALHRPDRALLRAAVPLRRCAHLVTGARRPGRLRGADDAPPDVPGGRQLGHALRRVAGGRPGRWLREVRRRRRARADAASRVHPAGDRRGLTRVRCPRGGRPRRPLPGSHAHDGALPHLLLPADALVLGELRALDEERRRRHRRAGDEALPGEARGLRAATPRRRDPPGARGVRRAAQARTRRL
ncbi:MAG: Trimethylamine methyltransferase family protein, partial [uncultured Nocardioidaceae bacterium]